MSISKPIFLYTGLILLSLIILATSFISQSIDETTRQLGLATPGPVMANQAPVEILVPSHGNYTLANPGLLPTHFLYPVKMIKDRLLLITSFNPETKAKLLFTYRNVRMSAANELIEQGATGQAITTAIKGQAYLFQAINRSQDVPLSKRQAWYDSLRLALLKHEEIIEKLRLVAKDQSRDQANQLWDQLEYYRQQVTSLSGAPFNYPRPEDLEPSSQDELQPYL